MSESLLAAEAAAATPETITTTTSAGWTGEDGSFAPEIFGKMPEDLKEHKATFDKYKSVPDLFRAYVSAQQLLGKKANAVIPPGEKATDDEKKAWAKAHRVPEDGKYNLKPKDLPEGVTWNDANEESWNKIFADHAASPELAKAVIDKFMADRKGQVSETTQEIEAAAEQRKTEALNVLRKEFGPNFGKNLDLARRAAAMAGIDENSEGFADPNVVVAFSRLGKMFGEDKLPQADASGSSNPVALANQIVRDKAHPMHEKYMKGEKETTDYVAALYARGEAMGLTRA